MSNNESDREAIKRLSNQSTEELVMMIICQKDELEYQREIIAALSSDLKKYVAAHPNAGIPRRQREETLRMMEGFLNE